MIWCIFEYLNFPPDHDLAEFFRDWDSTLWTIPKDIPQCKSTEPPGSAPYDFFFKILKIVAPYSLSSRYKNLNGPNIHQKF